MNSQRILVTHHGYNINLGMTGWPYYDVELLA